jgi:hypothetical protein
MNMQDQLDIQKWLKNKRIGGLINPQGLESDRGGLINFPSYHLVDINQVTPIISKYWIPTVFFSLGIAGSFDTIKRLFIDKQYSNICLPIIISVLFFLIAIVCHYIFISKKIKKLQKEATPVPPGAMEDFIESISAAGDTRGYIRSTST